MEEIKAPDALPILKITAPDLETLAERYLPFFRHGGVLIDYAAELPLSTPVFLLLKLPGREQAMACNGNIALVHRKVLMPCKDKLGFIYGVHFSQNGKAVNEAIQNALSNTSAQQSHLNHLLFSL